MPFRRRKVTIVGAGNVGATTAHWLVDRGYANIVLIDVIEGVPQGKALDLYAATPIIGVDCQLVGSNDYADSADSDIVVITAGIPRKPGMSRDDLLKTNAAIVKSVTENIMKFSPDAILIVISNPLDAMAWVAKKVSGLPRSKVIGMAGVLDSTRFRSFVAEATNVSVEDVHGFVYGSHGDNMVPMVRYCSISGIPIEEFLPRDKIDEIVQRTRQGGAEIVNLLKTGSAYYAPSASAYIMIEAILSNKKRILPCSVFLEGEYGLNDIYLGVLAKLGGDGMEEVIQLPLNAEEEKAFSNSAKSVRELIDALETDPEIL